MVLAKCEKFAYNDKYVYIFIIFISNRMYVRQCAGGGRCSRTIVKGTKAGRFVGRYPAMCYVSFFQMITCFRQETREKMF